MGITVIGLKIAGLILIVALLIIPAVTARFWFERVGYIVIAAGLFGGFSSYLGASMSALFPNLPTGPIIVLMSFFFFMLSFIFAPSRGMLAKWINHRKFQEKVHRRQGLLALAHDEKIFDAYTIKILRKEGYLRKDGVATQLGRSAAAKALLDEKRWLCFNDLYPENQRKANYHALEDISDILTSDELDALDHELAQQSRVI